jgi:hypothetical protein
MQRLHGFLRAHGRDFQHLTEEGGGLPREGGRERGREGGREGRVRCREA